MFNFKPKILCFKKSTKTNTHSLPQTTLSSKLYFNGKFQSIDHSQTNLNFKIEFLLEIKYFYRVRQNVEQKFEDSFDPIYLNTSIFYPD